jgi:hypothetical protein
MIAAAALREHETTNDKFVTHSAIEGWATTRALQESHQILVSTSSRAAVPDVAAGRKSLCHLEDLRFELGWRFDSASVTTAGPPGRQAFRTAVLEGFPIS